MSRDLLNRIRNYHKARILSPCDTDYQVTQIPLYINATTCFQFSQLLNKEKCNEGIHAEELNSEIILDMLHDKVLSRVVFLLHDISDTEFAYCLIHLLDSQNCRNYFHREPMAHDDPIPIVRAITDFHDNILQHIYILDEMQFYAFPPR